MTKQEALDKITKCHYQYQKDELIEEIYKDFNNKIKKLRKKIEKLEKKLEGEKNES